MARARSAVLWLAAFGLVVAPGCASVLRWLDIPGHKYDLEQAQRKYVRLLRWGEYDAASYLVAEELREQFRQDVEGFADVRFSDYEIIDTDINELRTRADILVSYRAYHLNRLIEYSWSEKQVWERDLGKGGWTVKPDLEKMRTALAAMQPQ